MYINYISVSSVLQCLFLIFCHTGTAPNIARNAIVNCTELVTYDYIKETILRSTSLTGEPLAAKIPQGTSSVTLFGGIIPGFRTTDDLPCHFVSAFGAGLCTTVFASPVDVVKTRYMNAAIGQYSSVLNCAATMMTKEGPLAFYKG